MLDKEPGLLYLALTGSRAYGIDTPESDYDYRGVFINTPEELFAIARRDSQEFEGDTICHSLREFCKLAINANPNIIELFFLDSKFHLYCHPIFKELLGNRDLFISQKFKYAYFGYAYSQLSRSKQKSTHGTLRPKYKVGDEDNPYDCKFAGHTIRLLINAKELITKGTLTPMLSGEDLILVKKIRQGVFFKNAEEFAAYTMRLLDELEVLFLDTKLRKTPDIKNINKLLVSLHTNYYKDQFK